MKSEQLPIMHFTLISIYYCGLGLKRSLQMRNYKVSKNAFNLGALISTLELHNLVMLAKLNNIFSPWEKSAIYCRVFKNIIQLCTYNCTTPRSKVKRPSLEQHAHVRLRQHEANPV